MPDGMTFISAVVGFGFVIVAGARLGAGSHTSLEGLFAAQGARDWPTGVQEGDAPRFVFKGPSTPPTRTSAADDPSAGDAPSCEMLELYAGPIRLSS